MCWCVEGHLWVLAPYFHSTAPTRSQDPWLTLASQRCQHFTIISIEYHTVKEQPGKYSTRGRVQIFSIKINIGNQEIIFWLKVRLVVTGVSPPTRRLPPLWRCCGRRAEIFPVDISSNWIILHNWPQRSRISRTQECWAGGGAVQYSTVQYSTVQGAARHISRHCGAARDNAEQWRGLHPPGHEAGVRGQWGRHLHTYLPPAARVCTQSKCEVPPLAVSSVRSPISLSSCVCLQWAGWWH